jgi:hypothetical protein
MIGAEGAVKVGQREAWGTMRVVSLLYLPIIGLFSHHSLSNFT